MFEPLKVYCVWDKFLDAEIAYCQFFCRPSVKIFSLCGVLVFIFYRNGDLTESTSDQEEEEIEPKFFSKENVKKNWFRQVKVLVLIGMAIVCTVSTVN